MINDNNSNKIRNSNKPDFCSALPNNDQAQ